MTYREEAVDLLESNISSLPDPDFGTLNLLPFTYMSDEAKAMRKKVCQGIVRVLDEAGFLAQPERPQEQITNVTMNCRLCGTTLARFPVGSGGVANVPAPTIISSLARLNLECPHDPVSIDDQRRKIEEAVRAAQQEEEGKE